MQNDIEKYSPKGEMVIYRTESGQHVRNTYKFKLRES